MNSKQFYQTVKMARKAQQDYFKYKRKEDLQVARHYEAIIDKEIARVEQILKDRNEPKMF